MVFKRHISVPSFQGNLTVIFYLDNSLRVLLVTRYTVTTTYDRRWILMSYHPEISLSRYIRLQSHDVEICRVSVFTCPLLILLWRNKVTFSVECPVFFNRTEFIMLTCFVPSYVICKLHKLLKLLELVKVNSAWISVARWTLSWAISLSWLTMEWWLNYFHHAMLFFMGCSIRSLKLRLGDQSYWHILSKYVWYHVWIFLYAE